MALTYFNRELETESQQQRAKRQIQLLRELVRAILDSNPFYQNKLRDAGVRAADDLYALDDLAHLPFTTKSELVEDQEANPPFGTNLTFALDKYIRLHQTSGTTGRPMRWLDTAESWDWWTRCWAAVLRAAGVGSGDRIFFPFSFGPFIGFWGGWAGSQLVGAMAISGGAQTSEQRLRNLVELNATVVCCTPSYALHLSQIAQSEGIDLRSSHVRALIVAGEPGGSIPATRTRIESAWGARVFDHSGATEVGAYGFTCFAQSGVHMNEAEFIVEVLEPNSPSRESRGAHSSIGALDIALERMGKPAERGELVITNLGRVGSPVIRYRTGDMVKFDRERCECGRTLVRMNGGILGRVDDMLTVRGVNIFPSAVENIVRRYEDIAEFAAEVYSSEELDELELSIEVLNGNADALAEILARDLQNALGLRVLVTPVPVGQLPRYELKARRFHDRRKK